MSFGRSSIIYSSKFYRFINIEIIAYNIYPLTRYGYLKIDCACFPSIAL